MSNLRTTRRRWWTATIAFVLLFLAFVVFFQAYRIPAPSMAPTLLVGDRILTQRVIHWPWAPSDRKEVRGVGRGSILVFRSPVDPQVESIKRVVGLPGERIRMENKTVYINDRPLDEPYAVFSAGSDKEVNEKLAKLPETVVPEGHFFMLGDNRDVSFDSRFWGPLPSELVTGRPLLIYWSFDSPTSAYLDDSIRGKIKSALSTAFFFFSRTRWDRVFQPVH